MTKENKNQIENAPINEGTEMPQKKSGQRKTDIFELDRRVEVTVQLIAQYRNRHKVAKILRETFNGVDGKPIVAKTAYNYIDRARAVIAKQYKDEKPTLIVEQVATLESMYFHKALLYKQISERESDEEYEERMELEKMKLGESEEESIYESEDKKRKSFSLYSKTKLLLDITKQQQSILKDIAELQGLTEQVIHLNTGDNDDEEEYLDKRLERIEKRLNKQTD